MGRRRQRAAAQQKPTGASPGDTVATSVHRKRFYATLSIHESRFSTEDLVVNEQCFPGLRLGDVLQITSLRQIEVKRELERNASREESPLELMLLQVNSLDPVKGTLQISVRKYIAELFGLQNREDVVIEVVSTAVAKLDFIEVSFKDQYFSRGDMWRLQQQLRQRCVFRTQYLCSSEGLRLEVDELVISGRKVPSGVISSNTKWVFRSKSAQLTWLVQLSEEMWETANDGELYFEKVINGVICVIFNRWKELSTNHSLSVVFYARTLYEVEDDEGDNDIDFKGRYYRDHYKVVIDAHRGNKSWNALRVLLKTEMNAFGQRVGWTSSSESKARPSNAAEGNTLEAINLALDIHDKHYMDRQCRYTGLNVFVFTAGNAVLAVDEQLAALTKERITDNGIGCDLISVSHPPLHATPLFVHKPGDDDVALRYEIPQEWMRVKHYDYRNTAELLAQELWTQRATSIPVEDVTNPLDIVKPLSRKLWGFRKMKHPFAPLPQCRVDPENISYQGNADDALCVLPIVAPSCDERELDQEYRRDHDASIFRASNVASISRSSSFYALTDLARPRHDLGLGESPPQTASPPLSMGSRTYSDPNFRMKAKDCESDRSSHSSRKRHALLAQRRDPTPLLGPKTGETCQRSKPQALGTMKRVSSSTALSKASRGLPALPRSWGHSNSFQESMMVSQDSSSNIAHDNLHISQGETSGSEADHSDDEDVNPFRPCNHVIPSNSRRRWLHLLAMVDLDIESNPYDELHIKSLTIPAILPLTCDFFPNASQRKNHFLNYVHTLTLIPDHNPFNNEVQQLLAQMIAQRLTHDFQVVDSSASHSGRQYKLSMADECHILTVDPLSDNIEVQRFVRRGRTHIGAQALKIFPYRYHLWSDHIDGFVSTNVTIASHHHDYNWNMMDQVTCGYIDTLSPSLKYKSNRFVLIPRETTTVAALEAFSVAAFEKTLPDMGICVNEEPITVNAERLRSDDVERNMMKTLRLALSDTSVFARDLFLQVDETIHLASAFNVKIQWFSTPSLAIEQFVRKLKFASNEAGYEMIQCRVEGSMSSSYPFHASLRIDVSEAHCLALLCDYILSDLGFIVQSGAMSQSPCFVHSTGIAEIHTDPHGLTWIPNTLINTDTHDALSADLFRKVYACSCALDAASAAITSILHFVVN